MLLHQDTLVRKDCAGSVARLGAAHHPVQSTLKVEVDGGGVGVGVVLAQVLDELTVALGAAVSYYDGEDGATFAAVTLKANACCHV